jgi:hypothetical protein
MPDHAELKWRKREPLSARKLNGTVSLLLQVEKRLGQLEKKVSAKAKAKRARV